MSDNDYWIAGQFGPQGAPRQEKNLTKSDGVRGCLPKRYSAGRLPEVVALAGKGGQIRGTGASRAAGDVASRPAQLVALMPAARRRVRVVMGMPRWE